MRVEGNLEEKDKQQHVQWCKERRRWGEIWKKKVPEPRLRIGYFPINISRYSRLRQKSTAAVLMEAKCAFVEREGLAMLQNMSKRITILGAFLPNSLLQLHMATTPPYNSRPPSERKDKKDCGGMNSKLYYRLAYLGPGGLNSYMGGLPGGKESYEIMEDGNSAHLSAYTNKERTGYQENGLACPLSRFESY